MKNKILSNGLAVVSVITAGLALTTNAKLQAHGHLHGDLFGRIMHKTIASSGSSSNITTLGAADCKTLRIARSGWRTDLSSRLCCSSPYGYWHCPRA